MTRPVLADSQPVVFLPGLFETAAIWSGIRQGLCDRETLCLDLPGHGAGETAPQVAAALADRGWIDMVLRRIDRHIGDDTFHLVGHSSGGLLGLMLASRAPARLESLVLVGAPIAGHRDLARDLGAMVLRNDYLGPAGLRMVWQTWLVSRTSFEGGLRSVMSAAAASRVPDRMRVDLRACDPAAIRAFALWLLEQDLTPTLAEIDTPTLVLIGAADTVVPPEHQLRTLVGTTTAQAQLLPDNHVPFLEDPDRFVATLARWLSHGLPALRSNMVV